MPTCTNDSQNAKTINSISFPIKPIKPNNSKTDPQLLWGEYDYASPQITTGPNRNYFCSWDGPLPTQHNCATHKGDGILDRAKAAGVQVMPSIGGWTLSDNFPTIAASEVGRREFAKNCVRLIEEYGFDGIDIGTLSNVICM